MGLFMGTFINMHDHEGHLIDYDLAKKEGSFYPGI